LVTQNESIEKSMRLIIWPGSNNGGRWIYNILFEFAGKLRHTANIVFIRIIRA